MEWYAYHRHVLLSNFPEKENIKSFYPHDTPHKYLFVTYMYPENHRYNNRNYLVDEWMYDTTPEITQFFKVSYTF
jgi:hypothetical protein